MSVSAMRFMPIAHALFIEATVAIVGQKQAGLTNDRFRISDDILWR